MELIEYLEIIKKRLWIIISITLLFTIISAVISFFVLTPIYESNTLIYVGKNANEQEALVYNDLLISNQLVNDYRELVKSRLISGTVIDKLNLDHMTMGQLSGKLNVSLRNDTRLIEITAQDEDKKLAMDIANAVAEVFKEKVVELMDVENVQIIDRAILPTSPVKPNKKLNIVIGTLLGGMLSLGIVLLIEYFDNTIKTLEDVEKHINVPVIGTIPVFPDVF